jgi:hypothetical protein
VRGLVLVGGLALVATLAGAVAKFEHPTLNHGGALPFSFDYRGLYRTSPAPGGYAKVQRISGGRLEDSFAVGPLALTPYRGQPSAALALYASGYIHRLASRYHGFRLRGEGWTQVDSISAYAIYNIFYRAEMRGRELYGRDVLLLPERTGARRGVAISMFTAVAGNRQVSSPFVVGAKGALEGPLKSFALG